LSSLRILLYADLTHRREKTAEGEGTGVNSSFSRDVSSLSFDCLPGVSLSVKLEGGAEGGPFEGRDEARGDKR